MHHGNVGIFASRHSRHPPRSAEAGVRSNVWPGGGGGGGGALRCREGGRGGLTRVTYFAQEGVSFKTSACPPFCKRMILFVPRYEVWE